MAYSNDMTQIKMGLVNYIGALLKSSKFEERAAKQQVASILIEEALKLSRDENDGPFDLYVLKPLLRATILLFKQRCNELSKLPSDKVAEQIKSYKYTIEQLQKLVDMV